MNLRLKGMCRHDPIGPVQFLYAHALSLTSYLKRPYALTSSSNIENTHTFVRVVHNCFSSAGQNCQPKKCPPPPLKNDVICVKVYPMFSSCPGSVCDHDEATHIVLLFVYAPSSRCVHCAEHQVFAKNLEMINNDLKAYSVIQRNSKIL